MFRRQRGAVQLVGDQNIGINTRDRKILDVGIDNNAAELTKIRAVRPDVLSSRAWPAVGQQVDEPDAAPPDIANASRRLERGERATAALMNACNVRLRIAQQVVESQGARA